MLDCTIILRDEGSARFPALVKYKSRGNSTNATHSLQRNIGQVPKSRQIFIVD